MKKLLLISALTALVGCQTAYYSTMEQFGVEKRDILLDRIEQAQSAQEDGQEQFRSALEQFSAVVNFDGGELQQVYDRLNTEFEDSEAAAAEIRNRIDAVESVSEDLFNEWSAELEQYTNQSLRRDSERQLRDTRQRYTVLIATMHRAEEATEPVLNSLRDNVLYLKHNLNAMAISSLRGELNTINDDVERLIQVMEQAISESDRFIAEMRTSST
jgi:membrane-associated HD superfamily phosphohydrolase